MEYKAKSRKRVNIRKALKSAEKNLAQITSVWFKTKITGTVDNMLETKDCSIGTLSLIARELLVLRCEWDWREPIIETLIKEVEQAQESLKSIDASSVSSGNMRLLLDARAALASATGRARDAMDDK